MKTNIACMSYLLISRRNWSTVQFKLSSVTIFFEQFQTSFDKSYPIWTSLGQYRQYDFSFLSFLFDVTSMGLWSQLTGFWWCFPYQNWDAVRTLQPEFLLFCPKITKNTTVTLYPNTGSIISSQNLSIIFNQ